MMSSSLSLERWSPPINVDSFKWLVILNLTLAQIFGLLSRDSWHSWLECIDTWEWSRFVNNGGTWVFQGIGWMGCNPDCGTTHLPLSCAHWTSTTCLQWSREGETFVEYDKLHEHKDSCADVDFGFIWRVCIATHSACVEHVVNIDNDCVLNVAHLLKEANPTKKANVLVLDRPWHWAPLLPVKNWRGWWRWGWKFPSQDKWMEN